MKPITKTVETQQLRHHRGSAARIYLYALSLLVSLLLIGSLVTMPALANTEENTSPVAQTEEVSALTPAKELKEFKETTSLVTALLKVVGSLVLVIGLMLLLVSFIKKLGLSGNRIKSSSLISVLDTRMIAPKKFVAVLEVANEFILVGITDQQINLLSKLENTDVLSHMKKDHSVNPSITSSFAAIFNKAKGGKEKSTHDND
ncbi:MAG: flagellar biosynthetic protein FliO [Proteobacteria bacterium]|nr:flagellar biosynthetic protein FliO [Pseudomonadota bacterium]MBU1708877.1 flagellar biosynthetic protein FliO [Pseudomonadota bacterium]